MRRAEGLAFAAALQGRAWLRVEIPQPCLLPACSQLREDDEWAALEGGCAGAAAAASRCGSLVKGASCSLDVEAAEKGEERV